MQNCECGRCEKGQTCFSLDRLRDLKREHDLLMKELLAEIRENQKGFNVWTG